MNWTSVKIKVRLHKKRKCSASLPAFIFFNTWFKYSPIRFEKLEIIYKKNSPSFLFLNLLVKRWHALDQIIPIIKQIWLEHPYRYWALTQVSWPLAKEVWWCTSCAAHGINMSTCPSAREIYGKGKGTFSSPQPAGKELFGQKGRKAIMYMENNYLQTDWVNITWAQAKLEIFTRFLMNDWWPSTLVIFNPTQMLIFHQNNYC